MKTDISMLPLRETRHALGVFLQMGRVQLDSDWNEQMELSLRLQQREANDAIRTGSPNLGFYVDEYVLLDAMDVRKEWSAEKAAVGYPDPTLYVDYFDFSVGTGSLTAQGAKALIRTLAAPIDCRDWKNVIVAAKGGFAAGAFSVYLGRAGTRGVLATTEQPAVNGWRIFHADSASATPAIDLSSVDEFGFVSLDPAQLYQIDSIKVDSPVRVVAAPVLSTSAYSATVTAGHTADLSIKDSDRFWHSRVLEATHVTGLTYRFPAARDFSHMRRLLVAARTVGGGVPGFTLTVTDATVSASHVDLAAAGSTASGSWTVFAFDIPQGAINWTQVISLKWSGLTPAATYRLGPVLAEMSVVENLVIMGGDGTPEGAGRFYGNGLAAVKEWNESYFSQRDLPEADPTALLSPANGKCRTDLAYLDLWERTITYIEDPDIREIALEGPDTCTRKQLVAQVRILKGSEVNAGTAPISPMAAFRSLLRAGKGLLTTKDAPGAVLDPCADPCEPQVAGTFTGEENRLIRIEIHRAGNIGDPGAAGTALFKWSRENGAVASALIADAEAGDFAVKVEKPELFSEGDLIEVFNDLVDLVTSPYEDRATHRNHERGELRKISSIDLVTRVISWEAAGSPEPQFHGGLLRAQRTSYHPGVRRWDALAPVTAGNIVLADGIVVEFGGSDMMPADFWVFRTRVVDRSVERLLDAPPNGIVHSYYPLAAITRCLSAGVETVTSADLRPRFDPLTLMKATEVSFDADECLSDDPSWAAVTNVQQAIDALCRLDVGFDIRDHNKHLHGSGVVCGLQVHCNPDREQVTIEKGYALDCEGHAIRVRGPITYDLVSQAAAIGALDAAGNGDVCITIRRGVSKDGEIRVEKPIPQTFWQTVLEGTLLLSFYRNCFEPVINFFKVQFLPLATNTVPVTNSHKLLVSVINLFIQLPFLLPLTGKFVFLSPGEHQLLKKFYDDLKALIASKTYCAMFDKVTPFPAYPYTQPLPGIDTAFGLFHFHRRVRTHPKANLAYTCGTGNRIDVYDLAARTLILSLEFPGGSNIEVLDVAVSPKGDRLYGVGLLNNQDAVFATAKIDLGTGAHTWGPTTVVCDFKFVTLGVTPVHPDNLYAIAQARGLYIFNPSAIPLAPGPANSPFNATGMMDISASPDIAVVALNSAVAIGTPSPKFDRCARVDLNAVAAPAVFFAASGVDLENDIQCSGDLVYITHDVGPAKVVSQFTNNGGAPLAQAPLGTNTVVRLAMGSQHKWLLVTLAVMHKAVRIPLSGPFAVDPKFRIPVQIFPFDIVASNTGRELYVLNLLSCTLSTVSVSAVLDAAQPPYTLEPPLTLSAYRTQIINAFADLVQKFWQYVKDCFCEQFLIDCPECDREEKLYLGCVHIEGRKVNKICNFTKRRYVKSVQLVEYWLSTVPILPVLKKAFADFCCKIL